MSAFVKAKDLVSKALILVHYDVYKLLKLYSDISPFGLCACLMHVNSQLFMRPVLYRRLNAITYVQIECETLDIVFGV